MQLVRRYFDNVELDEGEKLWLLEFLAGAYLAAVFAAEAGNVFLTGRFSLHYGVSHISAVFIGKARHVGGVLDFRIGKAISDLTLIEGSKAADAIGVNRHFHIL